MEVKNTQQIPTPFSIRLKLTIYHALDATGQVHTKVYLKYSFNVMTFMFVSGTAINPIQRTGCTEYGQTHKTLSKSGIRMQPLSIRKMPVCISNLTSFRLKLKPAMQSEKGTMACVSVRIHQTYIVVIPKMHINLCIF